MAKLKHFVGVRKKDRKAQVMFTNSPNGLWAKKCFHFVTGPFKTMKEAEAYRNALNNV